MDTAKFRLDLRDERLWRDELPVQITNKAFQLLRFFLQNPNRLLTKDEILDNVWPGVYVSEGLIKEYVHDLRLTLGDDPKKPTYIETVRGRGYRYLGGIACEARSIAYRTGPPRVAIPPWQHFGGTDRLRLFGRGFSAELTNLLAKNRDLAVIAKSSAATLAGQSEQIGRARQELHADYVIEGEVFPHDDGVRFALTAVNTETEAIIWSDSFAVQGSQLSGFETDLLPRVAMVLGARSGPLIRDAIASAKRRLPEDLTTFERYLLALDAYIPHTRVGIKQALELVKAALRRNPSHAQSWLLLAYILQEFVEDATSDEFALFKTQRAEAIGKAVALDPLDGRILIEHAGCLYDSGDHEGSARRYPEVHTMNRGVADVLTLVAKYLAGVNCNAHEALRALKIARNLNPVGDAMLASNELRTFYILGDMDAAIKAGEACPDTPLRSLFVALSHLEKGEIDLARDIALEARMRHPEFEPARFLNEQHYIRAPMLWARFRTGIQELSSYLGQRAPNGVSGSHGVTQL